MGIDTWQAIAEERAALADGLATLHESQWDVQSLCSAWKVRHVVGHLVAGADLKTAAFLVGILKSGMNFNRFMAREALTVGAAPPEELIGQFRKAINLRRAPAGAQPEILLLDVVCHSVDIRRPTGMTWTVPESTLLTVADTVKRVGFPLNAKKRIAGLHLWATDSDWSVGDGPSVGGPLASLVLVMAGRRALVDDLSGEGLPTLRSRV